MLVRGLAGIFQDLSGMQQTRQSFAEELIVSFLFFVFFVCVQTCYHSFSFFHLLANYDSLIHIPMLVEAQAYTRPETQQPLCGIRNL